jgi:hypothetical protein
MKNSSEQFSEHICTVKTDFRRNKKTVTIVAADFDLKIMSGCLRAAVRKGFTTLTFYPPEPGKKSFGVYATRR